MLTLVELFQLSALARSLRQGLCKTLNISLDDRKIVLDQVAGELLERFEFFAENFQRVRQLGCPFDLRNRQPGVGIKLELAPLQDGDVDGTNICSKRAQFLATRQQRTVDELKLIQDWVVQFDAQIGWQAESAKKLVDGELETGLLRDKVLLRAQQLLTRLCHL